MPGNRVVHPSEANHDVAKRPVIHVHHPWPDDPARVDIQLVPVMDVVVDRGGEKVVRQPDRMKITGEVQVDLLHGENLGIASPCGAPLHAEARPQRGLAEADHRLLPDGAERIGQTHRRRRFPLPCRGRTHCGHQDQLPILLVRPKQVTAESAGEFRDIPTVEFVIVLFEANPCCDLGDRPKFGPLGNFDICRHFNFSHSLLPQSCEQSPGGLGSYFFTGPAGLAPPLPPPPGVNLTIGGPGRREIERANPSLQV